jgi:hypothetical protein
LGHAEQVLNLYQRFKWRIIAELPSGSWTLNSEQVEQTVQKLREEDAVLWGTS